ncbi:MAG: hypothetical protein JNM10_13360 [Planctomycetia bacterium]|nr:hypothetical protein [Planctomycetia bacterium]
MKRELLDGPPGEARGTCRNVSHTSDGKFAPGNRAASGRRSRAAWREAFDRACSPSDLEAIARRAVRDAKAGVLDVNYIWA